MPQLYTCINYFHVSPSKIGNWSRNYSDYVSGPGNDATNHLMQRLKNIIPPLGKIGMYVHMYMQFNGACISVYNR